VSKCAKAHLQQSRISKFFWRKTRNRTLSGESVRAERVGLGERGSDWREERGKGKGGAASDKNLQLHHCCHVLVFNDGIQYSNLTTNFETQKLI